MIRTFSEVIGGSYEPTVGLRWFKNEQGENKLQQAWIDNKGKIIWKDIPCVTDKNND